MSRSRKRPIHFHNCKTLQWVSGKQILGAYLAIQCVACADSLTSWLDHLHDERTTTAGTDFDPQRLYPAPQCTAAEWLALYRNHRRVWTAQLRSFFPNTIDSGALFNYGKASSAYPVLPATVRVRTCGHISGE